MFLYFISCFLIPILAFYIDSNITQPPLKFSYLVIKKSIAFQEQFVYTPDFLNQLTFEIKNTEQIMNNNTKCKINKPKLHTTLIKNHRIDFQQMDEQIINGVASKNTKYLYVLTNKNNLILYSINQSKKIDTLLLGDGQWRLFICQDNVYVLNRVQLNIVKLNQNQLLLVYVDQLNEDNYGIYNPQLCLLHSLKNNILQTYYSEYKKQKIEFKQATNLLDLVEDTKNTYILDQKKIFIFNKKSNTYQVHELDTKLNYKYQKIYLINNTIQIIFIHNKRTFVTEYFYDHQKQKLHLNKIFRYSDGAQDILLTSDYGVIFSESYLTYFKHSLPRNIHQQKQYLERQPFENVQYISVLKLSSDQTSIGFLSGKGVYVANLTQVSAWSINCKFDKSGKHNLQSVLVYADGQNFWETTIKYEINVGYESKKSEIIKISSILIVIVVMGLLVVFGILKCKKTIKLREQQLKKLKLKTLMTEVPAIKKTQDGANMTKSQIQNNNTTFNNI